IAKPRDRKAIQHKALVQFVLDNVTEHGKFVRLKIDDVDGELLPSNIKDPGRCDGREGEIETLVSALTATGGSGTALVLGGPGFGKTTIALKAVSHPNIVVRFGPRRWLINLGTVQTGSEIIDAIAATIGLNRTVGIPQEVELP